MYEYICVDAYTYLNEANDDIVDNKSIKHEMYSRNAIIARFLVKIMEKSTNHFWHPKKTKKYIAICVDIR